jgi:hypothetical protein
MPGGLDGPGDAWRPVLRDRDAIKRPLPSHRSKFTGFPRIRARRSVAATGFFSGLFGQGRIVFLRHRNFGKPLELL